MEIFIDRRIYTDACISKAIYSLSGDYSISRNIIDDNTEKITIEAIKEDNQKAMQNLLFTTLNEYKLRQIIEEETHDIRVILYAKAFSDFDELEENV